MLFLIFEHEQFALNPKGIAFVLDIVISELVYDVYAHCSNEWILREAVQFLREGISEQNQSVSN